MNERLVSARELAELLGVSSSTILDWFEDGRLPGFKLNGRAVRFRQSEVDAWLEECRVGQDSLTRSDRRRTVPGQATLTEGR